MSDVPVAPKRSRRGWWVGLLLLVIAVGGGVWWRNRLTPEERLLVGRWQWQHRMKDGSIDKTLAEFRNDRTVFSSRKECRWRVVGKQIVFQESLPPQAVFAEWKQNGFKGWPINVMFDGQVEFVDDDFVIIMMRNYETGEYDYKLELKRIAEK